MLALVALLTLSAGALAASPLLPNPEYFASEADAREALSAATAKLGTEGSAPVLDKATGAAELSFAMERGWWTVAEEIMSAYRSAKVDLTAPLYNTASKIRRQVQKLQDGLQKQKFAHAISPAFRWAQSPSTVYLEQKFSHKWDTPATLGCKRERFVAKDRQLSFHALCKDKRKRFQLELSLFRPINAEASSVTFNSVGRATITLVKAVNASWPRLLRKRGSKPGNMHTWHAMRERFAAELAAFEKDGDNVTRPAGEAQANVTDVEASGEAAQPSPSPALEATPTPAAEATSTPEDPEAAAAAEKARVTDQALKEVAREEAAELAALRDEARRQKLEIDGRARADKAAVDAEAATKRAAIHDRFKAKRDELLASKA